MRCPPPLPVSALAASLALSGPAHAHFQELLPQTDILPEVGDRTVKLSLVFTHPAERGPIMDMGEPVQFGVLAGGKHTDLRSTLVATTVDGKKAFNASYQVKTPGDYIFYLEPRPYWEPAEKQFLVHYVKVVVDFGSGDGWDGLVGLPIEIQALTRPYGLWTGNLFRGVALDHGKPMPFASVEVEWLNDGSFKAPSDPFVTQVIKTDATGQFAYAMPRAGWWVFNALAEGKVKGPDGKPTAAELGGAIWVKAVDMK